MSVSDNSLKLQFILIFLSEKTKNRLSILKTSEDRGSIPEADT